MTETSVEGMVVESVRTDSTAVPEQLNTLRIEDLRKVFRRHGGQLVPAVDGVSLNVAPAEIVVLLGPSGCGKTTLLRSVAGLERPDSGRITIDDVTVFSSVGKEKIHVPPEKRPVGMIFQSYALWPHMTVFQNVAYPLQARRVPKREIAGRVMAVLESVGIPDLSKQYPGRLSGGQQQRVALARALVAGDRVVLFDEPLSNVDAKVRERLRIELLTMHAEIGFTALYVTHDQEEAMELGNRVAVLNSGRLEQIAPPRQVYERPRTRYVAGFVGVANEVHGRITGHSDGRWLIDTDCGEMQALATDGHDVGDDVVIVFRPERAEITSGERPSGDNVWPADVIAEMFSGGRLEYVVSIGGSTIRVRRTTPLEPADEQWVVVSSSNLRVFPATEEGVVAE